MSKEIEVIKEKIKGMQSMVDETIVSNSQELSDVTEKIKQVKVLGKLVKTEKEKYTKPAKEIIKEANSKYLPYEKECKNAEEKLKSKAGIYLDKQEVLRIEKEKKIAERVEKGNIKEETGVRKMEELGEEVKTVNSGDAQLQHKKIKEVVITDEIKIPRKYLAPNLVLIRKDALAGIKIAGVEVKEKSSIAIR